ncbi:MAG: hypothetical protein QW061_03110 [Candidatus Rehaiarchaeum fermentans]|nr:hypothetical protein [Candidatus Rehaiarchaeum fermentans]
MNEKLEELLKGNTDLQQEVNNIIHRYSENLAEEIFNSLVRIKSSTKDNEIVRIIKSFSPNEVQNLLTKYSSNTSNTLIKSFIKIAKYSNGTDILKALSSEFLNSNYSEKSVKKIAFEMGEIARHIKEDNTLLRIISTIFKYKGDTAEKVAWIFNNYSYEFYFSREKIYNLIELLSDEHIIKFTSKYLGRNLRKIIDSISSIGLLTKDKELVLKLLNSVENYNGTTASRMLYYLEIIAEQARGEKNAIIEALNTIEKYERLNRKFVEKVVAALSNIASSDNQFLSFKPQSIEFAAKALRLDEVLDVLKKHKEIIQDTIINTIAQISKYNFDEKVIRKIVDILNKYKEPEAVEDTAFFLYSLSSYLNEVNSVLVACNLIEKVGIYAVKILNAEDIEKIRKENLENIIKDKEDLDVALLYLRYGNELPPLIKEDIKNYGMKKYGEIILDYLNKIYEVKIDSLKDAQKLLSLPKEYREKLVNMIKNSKRTSQKLYSLVDKEILSLTEEDVNKLYNFLVISIIGSKDPKKEKEAVEYLSKIVDKKIIKQARIEFNSKYKNKLKEIIPLIKNGEFEKVIEVLRSLDNDKINSVIYYANKNNIPRSPLIFESVVTKNPLEYDSREQIACVYLPRSPKILDYCEDNRFVLIKYSLGGKTLGSAICYIENNIFLVDSVEGNRGLRKEKLFEIIYKDLLERAKERGCKMIVFNKDVMNLTPKEFVKFVRKRIGLKEINLRMVFYEVKEGDLEARDMQNKDPSHRFKGYLLNLY